MEGKHTPGPWEACTIPNASYTGADNGSELHVVAPIGREAYRDVAIVEGSGTLHDEANAALIAAAPDLLEAAQAIREAARRHGDLMAVLTSEEVEYVMSAIDKATVASS